MNDQPFRVSPDLHFYLDSSPFRDTVDALLEGLVRGDAFLLLTGDIGSGKTTVMRRLLDRVDRDQFVVGELSSLALGDDLFCSMSRALGVPESGAGDPTESLLRFLEQQQREGRAALLVIDEAQNLGRETLQRLAILSPLRASGSHRLHVFLIGWHAPPALAELERLGQPLVIGTACRLRALEGAETREYVLHRLRRAGWTGVPAFGEPAMDEIHARCGGIPGRINLLSSRVLRELSVTGAKEVSAELVGSVDELLKWELAGQVAPLAPAVSAATRAEPSARESATAAHGVLPPASASTRSAAPHPSERSAAGTSPASGNPAPGAPGGLKTFAIADFPVLHASTPDSPPSQAATGTPQAVPEPDNAPSEALAVGARVSTAAVPNESQAPLAPTPGGAADPAVPPRARQANAHPATAPADMPVPAAGRIRKLLPAGVAILALAVAGFAWVGLQAPADIAVRSQSVPATEADRGGEARRGGLHAGVVAPATVSVAPLPAPTGASDAPASPTAAPLPTAGVSAADLLPPALAPAAGTPAVRRTLPVPADAVRAAGAQAVTEAGMGAAATGSPPPVVPGPPVASPVSAAESTGVAATGQPSRQRQPVAATPVDAVAAPAPVASCTAAAQSMGLCTRPQGGDGGREPAPEVVREAAPRPCEPSRSALGLCADR